MVANLNAISAVFKLNDINAKSLYPIAKSNAKKKQSWMVVFIARPDLAILNAK